MSNLYRRVGLMALGLTLAVSGFAATVNVQPGDDLQAAVNQAGAGGAVIFAPGVYDILPADLSAGNAIVLNENHIGITLQGAGSGFDPANATIFNGDAGFLGTAIRFEFAEDVTVEGFTFSSFWNAAINVNDSLSVVIRDCWMMGNQRAINVSGLSGEYDFDTPDDFSSMIQFYNCAMAKAQDLVDINDFSAVLFMNCDARDAASDIFECEEDSITLIRNCIINAGFLSDDVQPEGNAFVEIFNTVFFEADKPDGAIDEMDHDGLALLDETVIYAEAMYVNANFAAALEEFDFHLTPGSPALTAGKDENGAPTFAGSAGPAQ